MDSLQEPTELIPPSQDLSMMSANKLDWTLKPGSLVLAPMVDASELAWRLLARRHGATLAFSPMFHAGNFLRDPRYRRDALQTCPEDRPLVVQFCGNDADTLLGAARLAEAHCDCVDLNLGCPQSIAKRGNYGAFLQDDWSLLANIVSRLSSELKVAVSCKVRVFPSIPRTVAYARMLEAAGCSMLTVHGRTREQKGPLTGLASWDHIKAVKAGVSIPVIGNGNIQNLQDALRLLEATSVEGVMSAEGHLCNPYLFQGLSPPVWEPALEYLNIVSIYPAPTSYIRGHLFKMFHKIFLLEENSQLREQVAKGSSLEEFREAVLGIREKYLPIHEGEQPYSPGATESITTDLCLPPWICQPYVRIPPEVHAQKMAQKAKEALENERRNLGEKRPGEENELPPAEGGAVLSKKKQKRMARRGLQAFSPHSRKDMPICSTCPNPLGGKCCFSLCKVCCRRKCYTEEADCSGHGILVRTRREKARSLGKPPPIAGIVTTGVMSTELQASRQLVPSSSHQG